MCLPFRSPPKIKFLLGQALIARPDLLFLIILIGFDIVLRVILYDCRSLYLLARLLETFIVGPEISCVGLSILLIPPFHREMGSDLEYYTFYILDFFICNIVEPWTHR